MKAVITTAHGGPEVLQYVENAEVPKRGDNELLVKVKAVGINPVETYIRTGTFPLVNPPLPFILGTDFAGVVEETCPKAAESFPEGARVFGFLREKSGAYAEYITVNPEADVIGILPDNASFSQGASIGIPYFTAYLALIFKGHLKAGQTVLIHGGSGGVGLAAIQIAKSFSARRIIATVGTELGEKNCVRAGATHVFYHNKADYADAIEKLVSDEAGVDLVVENAGDKSFQNDLRLLKTGGTVVVVGSRASTEVDLRIIMLKNLTVAGVILLTESSERFKEMLYDAKAKLASGLYSPICTEYPLSKAAESHQEIITPKSGGATGKIVLTI